MIEVLFSRLNKQLKHLTHTIIWILEQKMAGHYSETTQTQLEYVPNIITNSCNII